jgi:phage shock protein A
VLELDVIEARVPTRTPRMPEQPADRPADRSTIRFAPLAALFSSPIFSRTRDIFAANMTELLDRSEDPARMHRMIFLEMEETLF